MYSRMASCSISPENTSDNILQTIGNTRTRINRLFETRTRCISV